MVCAGDSLSLRRSLPHTSKSLLATCSHQSLIVGELFSGPAFGIGILAAGGYPRNYDHPLYRVCNA